MRNVAPLPAYIQSSDTPDLRVAQTLALIKTLLGSLPEQSRDEFYQEVAEMVRPMSEGRAGDLLNTVVRLLPLKKDWSVAELKQRIDEQGVSAPAKKVYNVMGYLTRKGRVRRIGYGRYIVDGVPLVTADEIGGQPSITEGDLDD